ncbi:Na+/H+ antiporter NhaC [Scopulibacillus daqui]|uniref:Na+/H+ antiporter NhaC n=1 Tax=Scopulibacillus daqui TaxID=1469162 RepID=A0ABS2PV78_9BACL|nr:Na+/H+ antiporter NhaC family protein [Scopulibacillus daqui]MBM7643925.1 Na+/H+ antiporter NhaC [Scopulibacillus daqui]
MDHWVSIIPFIVVIILVIFTKRVLTSLFIGLIVGGYLLQPHVVGGMQAVIDHLAKALGDQNNLKVAAFLYLFTALVGVIKHAGGIKGFVRWVSDRIKTKRGALIITWLSTLATFSAPSFRMVTVGPIMRALLDKIKMSAKELGFIIDLTGTNVIALIPIATAFVGYNTSIINQALKYQHIHQDPYMLYIRSIPFNFFAFSIIFIGIFLSFFHHSKKKVEKNKDPQNLKQAEAKGWQDCHPVVAKDLPEKPLNLVIPLILVIGLTLVLTWYSGYAKGYHNFFKAFIKADVLDEMLVALIVTIIVSFILFMFQKFKLDNLLKDFINGGNELMNVVILLSVIWALSLVTDELGFSSFVSHHVSWIPKSFVPPVLFVLGAAIAYFIGSSLGTWGILMPLGVSLAHVSGASLPLVIGAVFASGGFGTFSSPISDDTNTMAGILDLEVVSYAKYKLKAGLIGAAIAAIAYGAASFFIH